MDTNLGTRILSTDLNEIETDRHSTGASIPGVIFTMVIARSVQPAHSKTELTYIAEIDKYFCCLFSCLRTTNTFSLIE